MRRAGPGALYEEQMNIYSRSGVREILERQNIAPLKRLGQNFLIDENIVKKIADHAVYCDNVLEIGPGLGALTLALSKRAKRVIAVELDPGMVRALQETLADAQNVTVINADILKTDINTLFGGQPFCAAGNLPYYITAKCILKVLESDAPVKRFTAMVQKEVAERLGSEPGDKEYGAITASVRYYGRPSCSPG